MNQELDAQAVGEEPLPHPWWALTRSLAVLGAAALLTALLFLYYLRSRPVDLVSHTTGLADSFENALRDSQIPARHIERSEPTLERDLDAVWSHCSFDVEIPGTVDGTVAIKIIKREVSRLDIVIAEEDAPDPASTGFQLAFSGRTFASVRLHGDGMVPSRSTVAMGQDSSSGNGDLSAACDRIREEIEALLSDGGIASEAIRREPAVPMQDGRHTWTRSRLEVTPPPSFNAEQFVSSLREAMQARDVEVSQLVRTDSAAPCVIVSYAGLECVELVLGGAEGLASLPAVELPQVPTNNGGNGLRRALDVRLPQFEELPLDSIDLDDKNHLAGEHVGPDVEPEHPRVAIIVDDGGYGGTITDDILGLDPSLTLAILPFAPHSTRTAQEASAKGFEVMLHMPMESFNRKVNFPGCLKVGMSKKEIAALTDKALEEVPGAVGVNNHTGSKFTSDGDAMGAFLQACDAHSLFFIDSRTTGKSMAFEVAQDANVPTLSRDLFLDHENGPDYMREQVRRLIALAKRRGRAVGICHFRADTAGVLGEVVPWFEKDGVDIVHVSELLQ